jgi:hypothetical protein
MNDVDFMKLKKPIKFEVTMTEKNPFQVFVTY